MSEKTINLLLEYIKKHHKIQIYLDLNEFDDFVNKKLKKNTPQNAVKTNILKKPIIILKKPRIVVRKPCIVVRNPVIKKKPVIILKKKKVVESKPEKTFKKKKKIIIRKKRIMTDYDKFVEFCKENNYHYVRHKNKYGWEGPAIITDESDEPTLDELESCLDIDLQNDPIAFNYIVYPNYWGDPTSIKYPPKIKNDQYLSESDTDSDSESENGINVIEWTYNGITYQCDKDTGDLYNDEDEYVGRRHLDNDKYYIELISD
jgi:hypothetical protein